MLHNDGKLTNILQKAKALTHLEQLLRKELSQILSTTTTEIQNLLTAIHVSNYEHGRLHVSCDNAAISTRLRYLIPQLIKQLRNNLLPELINIELSVGKLILN